MSYIVQLCIKILKSDKEIISKVSQARGETISSFVRRSIRKELAGLNYYTSETKKALGISEIEILPIQTIQQKGGVNENKRL